MKHLSKRLLVVHPLLFAMSFVLALYSFNAAELLLSSLWIPLAASFGFALVLFMLSWLLFRNARKAGIVTSIFIIIFFADGHIHSILEGWWWIRPAKYLPIAWAILFIGGVYLTVRTKRKLYNLTTILSVVAATLVVVSSISIVAYELKRPALSWENNPNMTVVDSGEIDTLPDIYYIILDAYASSGTLKEVYHYDNREFIDYLTEKGFFVASESRSNYSWTILSLASSLNMEHLDRFADTRAPYQEVFQPMVENSEVMRFLKSQGYKFVFLGSGQAPTLSNEYADLNVQCDALNEFSVLMVRTTMLRHFCEEYIRTSRRESMLCTFSKLGEVPEIEGPKFVFAHIMCPHPPYVFGADGEPVEDWVVGPNFSNLWDKDCYLNQLIFLNTKIKVLVDEILSNSESTPVIVLQADHGPASWWPGPITEELIIERMGILNAYHLPGKGNDLLYDSITPVNTFRLILDLYFGTDYGLLSDDSYFSYSGGEWYNFVDVTD